MAYGYSKEQLAEKWIKFRTSYAYIYMFMGFVAVWIVASLMGFMDREFTTLNLIISVTTELQSILLLIYLNRIDEQNRATEARDREYDKELHKKIDALMKRSNTNYGTFSSFN